MEQTKHILILGDSILKGVQVDPETGKYTTRNDMGIEMLESEFDLEVRNESHFGATVRKGTRILDRLLAKGIACDAVIMDFGGNDCDHVWSAVAADPAGEHQPNVPLAEFTEKYRAMIGALRQRGITPVLTTLPPLVSQRFFDWWCRELDKKAVRSWLGDVNNIYAYQERYSRAVEQLAKTEDVPLVDLRGAFLAHERIEELICEDGTHPNSAGQALIRETFRQFCKTRWAAAHA